MLDYLGHALEPSILIGGWATFLRVGGDISYDIDLIIGSDEVRAKIKNELDDVSESPHLQAKKRRGTIDGVHVDIYIPHESELGAKLRLKVEVLAQYTESISQGGWKMLLIEAHIITKFAALLDRADSEKGHKDGEEILRLLKEAPDENLAMEIYVSASNISKSDLRAHLSEVFKLLSARMALGKRDRKNLEETHKAWDLALSKHLHPLERERPIL